MLINRDNFKEGLEAIKEFTEYVIDTETTGFKILGGEDWACGIGVCGVSGTDEYYFALRMESKYKKNLTKPQRKALMAQLSKATMITNANLKFDMKVLIKDGLANWQNMKLHDIYPMKRLCSQGKFPGFELTEMITQYYGLGHIDFDKEFKDYLRKNKYKKFSLADPDKIAFYCCEQVKYSRGIYQRLLKEVVDSGQEKVWKLEVDTTMALLEMELEGIPTDLKYCQWASENLKKSADECCQKVYGMVGHEFNLQSAPQVGKVFADLGIHSPLKTPTGKEAWGDAVITLLNHPVATLIREHRTLEKLRNTYFDDFIEDGGTVHCNFSNWTTITGRLSCKNPNLQNVPRFWKVLGAEDGDESTKKQYINQMLAASVESGGVIGGHGSTGWAYTGDESFDDSKEGLIAVRRAFVAPPGYRLYSYDFSQMEIRVLLSYIEDGEEVLELMNDKEHPLDFHSFMAKRIYSIDETNSDFKFFRTMAKGITFGLIYGMGLRTLAASIGRSKSEARELKMLYFEKLPGVEKFIHEVEETVRRRGWVKNKYGRKYYIELNKAYVGVNYLIQGTAAEIVKERMNALVTYLRPYKTKCLVQIHDEVLVKVHEDDQALIPIIRTTMEENNVIPLRVDVAECWPSWAHHKED